MSADIPALHFRAGLPGGVLVALLEANRSAVLEPGPAPAVPTSPHRPGPGGGRALTATGTAPSAPAPSLSSTPRPRAVPQPPSARPAGPRSSAA
ncbi:MAG TPA: hypothetical protein VLR26_00035 [Frankiaceae bacterium]|nr:hypothetical protein [Frankiaceae bacterium]